MTKITLLLILLFLSSGIYGQNLKPGNKTFPFSFRENKGQVTDQEGKPRTDIDFILQTPGMSLTLGNAQLHYQFVKREGMAVDDILQRPRMKVIPRNRKQTQEQVRKLYRTPTLQVYRLDVILFNANKHAKIIKEHGREEQYHYYNPKNGSQGITGVQAYEKVTYKDIYPNIDWVLYTRGQELKYDFIVHPGGKVSDIKLQYEGADTVSIAKDGSLVINTPFSKITEQAPFAYEQKGEKKIAAQYKLQGNIAGFTAAPFQGTLIIDPSVDWATYFGSDGDEYTTGTACDTSGNVYIVGYTTSTNSIATTGAHQSSFGGGSSFYFPGYFSGLGTDGFLAKFDSLGQLKWATYYGGDNTILSLTGFGDFTAAVACDAHGHVYIAGGTNAENGIATPGSFQDNFSTNFIPDTVNGFPTLNTCNAYLAQFTTEGIRKWGTYYGASTTFNWFSALTCDKQGNVYVAGNTDSAAISSNIVTPGAFQTTYAGGDPFYGDGEIVKFDSSGNRIWGTYFGGNAEDGIAAITCDTAANIYITGILCPGLGTPGTFLPTQATPYTGFLAKLNTNGVRQWCTYINGFGCGVAIDPYNHLYVSGLAVYDNYDSLITTPGAYMEANLSGRSDFLMQLNPQNGQRNWGTYYSGERMAMLNSSAVACDASGNVFLAGATNSRGLGVGSTTRLATPGSHQDTLNAPTDTTTATNTSNAAADLYLAQFDSTGARKWGTYYGGENNEGQSAGVCNFNTVGLSTNNKGAIYLYSATQSTAAIATPGAHQTTIGGNWDGFLVKFLPLDITLSNVVKPSGDTICAGTRPLSVLVKNQGRMDKTDPLVISYSYTGPINGSGSITYNNILAAGASETYALDTIDISQPGSYSFAIYLHYTQDDDNSPNDTLLFNLFVIAPPVADIGVYNIGSTFHFSNNNTQPSYSYSWDFGDGQSSTEAGPSHTYNEDNATYTVTLILNNACGSDTASIIIDRGGTGIQQPAWGHSVMLYPNPARQYLSVQASQDIRLFSYSIINELGQTLMQGTLEQKNTIDVSALAAGHYLIRIKTDKGWVNRQISLLRD